MADRDGEPSSMFQNGIIVHYDTQEHTSRGVLCSGSVLLDGANL